MSAAGWLVLALYFVPLLVVFAVAAWVSDEYERRNPPRNRRIRR
jgi:hypothetical protein